MADLNSKPREPDLQTAVTTLWRIEVTLNWLEERVPEHALTIVLVVTVELSVTVPDRKLSCLWGMDTLERK